MCYHTKTPTKAELRKIIPTEVKIFDYPEASFANGFAAPMVPVLKNDDFNAIIPWPWLGFATPGAKQSYTTLNATCEKVFDSKLYGDSIRTRRCLMFVQGFYEWSPVGMTDKKKTPYYIDRIDGQPFAMAGIWKDYGATGLQCLSIITTPANELLTTLRPDVPRMTLILEPTQWDQWLDPGAPEEQVRELFQILPDGILKGTKLEKSPLSR